MYTLLTKPWLVIKAYLQFIYIYMLAFLLSCMHGLNIARLTTDGWCDTMARYPGHMRWSTNEIEHCRMSMRVTYERWLSLHFLCWQQTHYITIEKVCIYIHRHSIQLKCRDTYTLKCKITKQLSFFQAISIELTTTALQIADRRI